MVLENILLATFVVSLISFVGVFTLSIKDELLHKLLPLFVAFAAGSMLAAAFYHMLPEAIAANSIQTALPGAMAGIVLFFLIERFLHWHHHHKHHHKSDKEEYPVTYLVLIGDTLHNFVDGTVIAASFMVSFETGAVATAAIVAHEIPQEIGDFSLLIWGGFTRAKALLFNFISALAAVLGGLLTFYLSASVPGLVAMLLPLAAGQFLYIACADLVPELKKEVELGRSIMQLAAFGCGMALILILTQALPPV